MWTRYGRFLSALLGLLLLSSWAYSGELNPLETGVREWAADKDKEQVVEKLVKVVITLGALEIDFERVERLLAEAQSEHEKSLTSFDAALAAKDKEIARVTRVLWMDRIKYGLGGVLVGALIAGAFCVGTGF